MALRLMLLVITSFVVPRAAQEPTLEQTGPEADDRFALFTDCARVEVFFEPAYNEQESENRERIGLSEASVWRAVTSRLRAARVFREQEDLLRPPYRAPSLNVQVSVSAEIALIDLVLRKSLLDGHSGVARYMTTWFHSVSPIAHRNEAVVVLAGLSQAMDVFVDEYLRVNAESC